MMQEKPMPTSSSGSYFLMMASRIIAIPIAIITTLPHQSSATPVCAPRAPKNFIVWSSNIDGSLPLYGARRSVTAPHAFLVERAKTVQEGEQAEDQSDARDHHHAKKEIDQTENYCEG